MAPAHKSIRIIFIMLSRKKLYRDNAVDYGGTSGQRQSAALESSFRNVFLGGHF
jgi:hypothetical protein